MLQDIADDASHGASARGGRRNGPYWVAATILALHFATCKSWSLCARDACVFCFKKASTSMPGHHDASCAKRIKKSEIWRGKAKFPDFQWKWIRAVNNSFKFVMIFNEHVRVLLRIHLISNWFSMKIGQDYTYQMYPVLSCHIFIYIYIYIYICVCSIVRLLTCMIACML